MLQFILFLMATAGMTRIILYGFILEKFRNFLIKISPNFFGELLICPQCVGFWSGIFCSILLMKFNILIILACGCAGSFFCEFMAYVLNCIDAIEMLCKMGIDKMDFERKETVDNSDNE
jgi:hypothetical protein